MRDRKPSAAEAHLEHAGIRLDPNDRRAYTAAAAVDLSSREYTLLEFFMRNPGQMLTRDQILARVWTNEIDPDSNIVSVYVQYLRRKLGEATIETVRGVGYRLTAHRQTIRD